MPIKFSDFQRQKEKKNGEPIEIMFFFFYHSLMLHAYSLPPSPGPPVSPTIKTNHHDITEILLKVVTEHR